MKTLEGTELARKLLIEVYEELETVPVNVSMNLECIFDEIQRMEQLNITLLSRLQQTESERFN